MSRSQWKKPYIAHFLQKKCVKSNKEDKIVLWCRNSTIPAYAVGLTVEIHNGKTFTSVNINEKMVGLKFGEFAATRKPYFFKKKN